MDKSEVLSIFNEMVNKVYKAQDKKRKGRLKYKEQCSITKEEKNQFSTIFENLVENREKMNLNSFLDLFIEKEA